MIIANQPGSGCYKFNCTSPDAISVAHDTDHGTYVWRMCHQCAKHVLLTFVGHRVITDAELIVLEVLEG